MKGRFLMLAFAVVLLTSPTAFAKKYRCDGVVRTRPCEQQFSSDSRRNARQTFEISEDRFAVLSRRSTPRFQAFREYGEIVQSSFHKISRGLGVWTGWIRGNGRIHLHLKFFRNGALETSRYMGNVLVSPRDKDVSFKFKTPLPAGKNWSWRIVASVT